MQATTVLYGQVLVVLTITLSGIWGATQWTASALGHQARLGMPWFELLGAPIYHPWRLFEWWFVFDAYAPEIFNTGDSIAACSSLLALAVAKEHWTKIEERFLTRAFKDAREAAECYASWKDEEQPGFHEVRALSLHLYKKAGKDGQKIAGHSSEGMTKNYQRDHAEIIWAEAVPDLDISEIAR